MSARCTGLVFDYYPEGAGEFALALALADTAHDDGTHIYPNVDTMALKSRQDARTVQRHLKRMLAIGWLELVRPAAGRGRPAEYRINPRWVKGDILSVFPELEYLREKDGKLSPIWAQKRVTSRAEKGDIQNTPYKNRKEPNTPLPPFGGASGFETIAAGYPRRAGIDAARRDWAELAPDEKLQAEIARAIQAWIPSAEWQRDGGRFIPKLGKFLRDKRWLDAPAQAAPSPLPVLPPARVLSPQELAANGERARQAAALARTVLQQRGRKAVGVAC